MTNDCDRWWRGSAKLLRSLDGAPHEVVVQMRVKLEEFQVRPGFVLVLFFCFCFYVGPGRVLACVCVSLAVGVCRLWTGCLPELTS